MLLLLFDIDGTMLLKASAEHAASMHAALRAVHGIPDPAAARVAAAGRTDGEITRQILLRSGVSADRIDARADEVREVCCEEFGHRCPPDLRDKVAPGMAELLDGLAERDDVFSALLTATSSPSPASSSSAPASATTSPRARARSAPTTRTARLFRPSRATAPPSTGARTRASARW